MTPKEALLKMGMRAFIDDAEQKQSAKEFVNFAFASLPEYKVLEKEIKLSEAVEPVNASLFYKDTKTRGMYACPTCHDVIYLNPRNKFENPNCCSNCGQKLDWGKKTMSERIKKGTLYDYIANNYHNMSKEELKSVIHETLWRLNQCTTEEDYIKECEEIIDNLSFLNGDEE